MLSWGMYCLSGTLPCVDFMYVTVRDVPFEWDTSMCRFSCMLSWGMSCLSGTLPCGDFIYVTMGDVLFEWDTSMCRFHVCYHGGCTV